MHIFKFQLNNYQVVNNNLIFFLQFYVFFLDIYLVKQIIINEPQIKLESKTRIGYYDLVESDS